MVVCVSRHLSVDLDQLNELCITDIDEFERAVGDITFANDVARDYFDTALLCGWMGDYGKYAVHITDQEERRHPETETHGTGYEENPDDTTAVGQLRCAKGGRLPRPVFNMASGQDNFNTENILPVFPARGSRELDVSSSSGETGTPVDSTVASSRRAHGSRPLFKAVRC